MLEALVSRKDELENVEIVHMVPLGKSTYTEPGMEKHFCHNSIFAGASTRDTIMAGHGDYTPCFFHKIPDLFETTLPLDAAFIHVSSPDEHGYMSLGVSVDYSKRAASTAKVVIAQVNRHMPRTLGNSFVHVSDIDCIVEFDQPVLELPPPVITDVEKQIGENCARLIQDGDTLQLGIGAIPDAVLLFLKAKKDLGIHSEMFSDGVVELVHAGVINNPAVEMYPVDYVNDPVVIAQNDNLVSINSCVQVDFLGQVVSDTVGAKQISGVGGQVDFVRGAAMSRGGRSIIAMPSTKRQGQISSIVPFIDEWAAVTTSRNEISYIVTEYGIADLKGRTVRDRARRLIEIAHPRFRDELKQKFEHRFQAKF